LSKLTTFNPVFQLPHSALMPIKWVVSYDYGRASRQAKRQHELDAEMRLPKHQKTSDQHLSTIEEQDIKLTDDLQNDEGFTS